jgi:hypothetical protein
MSENRPRIDYTSMDYASLREAMLALARERLPEWTDHSPNDPGVVLVELFAAMGDAIFYHQDRIASESYLETASERRSVLDLLRLVGYELKPPAPASADLTLVFKEGSAPVKIATEQAFTTKKDGAKEPVQFLYVRPDPITLSPGTLPAGYIDDRGAVVVLDGSKKLPDGKVSVRVFTRGLPVVQVDTVVTREIVASSDGSKRQRYPLARRPVILGSLRIEVNEGVRSVEWIRKDTLLYSAPEDPHYVVRFDEDDVAWIELGDDRYGKAPARGRDNIVARYRTGGGVKGNVAPRTIVQAIGDIPGLVRVVNEVEASGGADHEPIEEAVQRGPQQFRAMGRAVTAADYELLARASGLGIAKAKASAGAWNRVNLFVAPVGGGPVTATLRSDLKAYFEPRRMLNTTVVIQDPLPVEVMVTVTVDVEPRYPTRQIRQRAEDVGKTLFGFDSVDFGQTLYLSKIYEALEAIEGVRSVAVEKFWRKGVLTDLPTGGRLKFSATELPDCKSFALTVTGGNDD